MSSPVRHSRDSGNPSLNVITDHLDIWTTAETPKKAGGRGRGAKTKKSPHGIKKLRELILDLAVRGKLVPQDPNDEPASVLLEKIAAEKERLVKKGIIKKQKIYPEISEGEEPFNTPENWQWVRVSEIGHNWGQVTPDCRFTYIDVSAIDSNKGKIISPTVLDACDAPSRARKVIQKGTVIYSTVRPYLKNICVIDQEYDPNPIASTAFAIIQPYLDMPGSYFSLFLKSPVFVHYVESVQTGIAYPAINDKQFFSGVLPLPPLAEQHRIVAKVDELMALCDVLEQEQTDSSQAHQTLVETLLATLTQTQQAGQPTATDGGNAEHAAAQSGAAAWLRIAEHFDTLFTTEQSIDQLKQTILQLAVMGKLVPQNPNDEPASELLKKIAAEKAKLIKEKKIKKQKAFPEIGDDEKPFELPKEWVWERLGNLCVLQGGFAYKSATFFDIGKYQVIRMGNIRPNQFRLNQKEVFIGELLTLETLDYEIFPDDIVLTMTGTKGKRDYLYTVLVNSKHVRNRRLFLNQRLCIIRNIGSYAGLLNIVLKDNRLLDRIYASSTGSANQANIGMIALSNWAVPIPPLAEQHRIVAKVEELMALCDRLKERLKESQITQVQLADAIVEQAII